MKKLTSLLVIIFLLFIQCYGAVVNVSAKTNEKTLALNVREVSTLKLPEKSGVEKIKWASANKKIVTIASNTGKLTAVAPGKTTVTCAYKKNKKNYKYKRNINVKSIPKPFTYGLIAHALGGLENKYIYSNALEGLEQSTSNGYKFMETDIIFTADGKLVCSHGWTKFTYDSTGVTYNAENPVMNYDQFMNTKIQGKYTTIDLSTIVNYMKEHKDVYFNFDLRILDKDTAIKTTKKIVEAFGNDTALLDRILMQAGSKEMYDGIDSIYHFKYYEYFIEEKQMKNIDSIIDWCKSKNISVVSIYEDAITDKAIKSIHENGMCVLVHTVDDVSETKSLLKRGVDLLCTDFVTYADLK